MIYHVTKHKGRTSPTNKRAYDQLLTKNEFLRYVDRDQSLELWELETDRPELLRQILHADPLVTNVDVVSYENAPHPQS